MPTASCDGAKLAQHGVTRLACRWAGGAAYAAERDGAPYVIIDEGTMATLVDAEDLGCLVQVMEFDSAQERDAYVVDTFPSRKHDG